MTLGKQGGGPLSPSLDRIVPEKGYVPGNVRVISSLANAMKQNATVEELRLMLMHLLAHHEIDNE